MSSSSTIAFGAAYTSWIQAPMSSFVDLFHRAPSSCSDGAPSRVFPLALADCSSSSRQHILSTFNQSSVTPVILSSSLSSIPMASYSARSIDLTNSRTLFPLQWVFADATQWSKSRRFLLLGGSPYARQSASSKISHKLWPCPSCFTSARIQGAMTRQKNSSLNASFTPCTSISAL